MPMAIAISPNTFMAEAAADEALVQFLYRAPIGLIQTTLDGTIILINPMSAQLLMPLAVDGALDNLFEVLKTVAPGLRNLANANAQPGDIVCDALPLQVRQLGATRGEPLFLGLHMMRLDDTTLMACVTDISVVVQRAQQRLQARLHGQKRVDALTSLPNRTAVLERMHRALSRAQDEPAYDFALMLVNADRFERINVTLGHATGDEVLCLMGRRVGAAAHELGASLASGTSSPMAARLGADEFVLFLDMLEGSVLAAVDAADRLVSMLQEPYAIGEQTVHLSASVGLVTGKGCSGNAEELLELASLAMRDAKRAGGARRVVFESEMMDRARQLGDLELGLRTALSGGQLCTEYQPIVALADGSVVGMEALVRWRHPQRGMVMPAEFIAVAEASGLIRELGDWIINDTCRQLVVWRALLGDRAPRTVSVNLSRAQLADRKIVERVANALEASGLPAACLQLEITESLAAQDTAVQARLSELRGLGLTLALDDFGTGYSSLSSLHELPVDVIKIDRSFVTPIEASAHHRVLIEAIVHIARSLGMVTVAEGIETAGQAALLRTLGCDKGQGYFYARPMAAERATSWLRGDGATISHHVPVPAT